MRRKQRQERLKKKSKSFLGIFILLFVIFVIAGICFWIKVGSTPKFSFVNKTSDGGGEIVVIDGEEVVKYKIDPEMVLVSARGFGEYKVSSLWILGEKEGFGGKLVSETVTTNFLIPVYLWKNENSTNLNLYQKLKVLSLDFKDISYDRTLSNFEVSNSVRINFLDNNLQESGTLTEVDDLTGNPLIMNKVSSVIDALGTKVSGYTKGYDKDLDCEVTGLNTESVKLLSKVFECEIIEKNEGGSDLKIRLGAKFAERF